jgi:hypothetical protein
MAVPDSGLMLIAAPAPDPGGAVTAPSSGGDGGHWCPRSHALEEVHDDRTSLEDEGACESEVGDNLKVEDGGDGDGGAAVAADGGADRADDDSDVVGGANDGGDDAGGDGGDGGSVDEDSSAESVEGSGVVRESLAPASPSRLTLDQLRENNTVEVALYEWHPHRAARQPPVRFKLWCSLAMQAALHNSTAFDNFATVVTQCDDLSRAPLLAGDRLVPRTAHYETRGSMEQHALVFLLLVRRLSNRSYTAVVYALLILRAMLTLWRCDDYLHTCAVFWHRAACFLCAAPLVGSMFPSIHFSPV